MKKFIEWLHKIVSIDEARVSTTIICLLASLTFDFIMYVLRGDITSSLENITITLILTVGGISTASKGMELYQQYKQSMNNLNSSEEETTDTDNNSNPTI